MRIFPALLFHAFANRFLLIHFSICESWKNTNIAHRGGIEAFIKKHDSFDYDSFVQLSANFSEM